MTNETSPCLIKVAQDKKWLKRGKEIEKLVKNYWDWGDK